MSTGWIIENSDQFPVISVGMDVAHFAHSWSILKSGRAPIEWVATGDEPAEFGIIKGIRDQLAIRLDDHCHQAEVFAARLTAAAC